jgi:hypothetical protein
MTRAFSQVDVYHVYRAGVLQGAPLRSRAVLCAAAARLVPRCALLKTPSVGQERERERLGEVFVY